MGQADGLPFQLHAPAFIAADRPALQHLDKALQTTLRLTHAAVLQLTLAQHLTQDAQKISTTLDPALSARNWTNAARAATSVTDDLKLQQVAAGDAEALLDPLWTKWIDAMLSVVTNAQQYSLASAANQGQLAQQYGRNLATARQQVTASFAAAQNDAAAWAASKVQPLLDTVTHETAAGG
jgi:hypothetical protein